MYSLDVIKHFVTQLDSYSNQMSLIIGQDEMAAQRLAETDLVSDSAKQEIYNAQITTLSTMVDNVPTIQQSQDYIDSL